MAWIRSGHFGKRVPFDKALPIRPAQDEKISGESQSDLCFGFDFRLDSRGRSLIASQNKVAALKQSCGILEPNFAKELAQVRHLEQVVSTHIDAPDQTYEYLHCFTNEAGLHPIEASFLRCWEQLGA